MTINHCLIPETLLFLNIGKERIGFLGPLGGHPVSIMGPLVVRVFIRVSVLDHITNSYTLVRFKSSNLTPSE